MNFAFKPVPHIRKANSVTSVLNTVFIALIFVSVVSIYNQFIMFGADVAMHVGFMFLAACFAALVTQKLFHILFDLLEKRGSFSNIIKKPISIIPPCITAIILVLALPAGTSIFVIVASVVFAEIIGKLLFGGFGQNIFNPAAVGFVFATIAFGDRIIVPRPIDSITGATPMSGMHFLDWGFSGELTNTAGAFYVQNMGGYMNLLMGTTPGAIGETARLALIVALIFMISRKVVDWVIPVAYLGTIFIMAKLIGLYLGIGIWYPMVHILTGGIIFGAVFLANDPVTTPVNRQGRLIFAILFAMFTLLIRIGSTHAEGVGFAILLVNMLVPFIDQRTASLTTENINKKIMSVGITFVVAVAVVLTAVIGLS